MGAGEIEGDIILTVLPKLQAITDGGWIEGVFPGAGYMFAFG